MKLTAAKPFDASDIRSVLQYCVDHVDALESLDGAAKIVQDIHGNFAAQGWKYSITPKQRRLISFAFAVVCRKYPLRPQSALDRMRTKKAALAARTHRDVKAKRTREGIRDGQITIRKSEVIDSYETTVNARKARTLKRRYAEFSGTARQQKGTK